MTVERRKGDRWLKKPRLYLSPMAHNAWERFLQELSGGKVLQGRVLWRLPEGKWIIRLLGCNLIAQSEIEFSEGESITIRVEALGPPVVVALSRPQEEDGDAVGPTHRLDVVV